MMQNITLIGSAELDRKLASITSRNTRVKIMRKIGMKARMNIKKRVTAQTDLNGMLFSKRNRKRTKGKMLSGLAQRLAVKDITDTGVTIGWNNTWESGVAYRNQFGERRTVTRNNFSQETTGSNAPRLATDPATRRQAKRLLDAGYKIRRPGGRGSQRPTITWIVANMTIAQAGVILRSMLGTKQSWSVTLPARSFIGVADAELQELAALAIDTIDKELGHA